MTGYIYFLFFQGRLLLIGQTIDLYRRIKEYHYAKIDFVRFIKCDLNKLVEYERRLITYFKPPFNKNHNPNRDSSKLIRLPTRNTAKRVQRNYIFDKKSILVKVKK